MKDGAAGNMPIPSIDRGRGDPRYILGVILSVEKIPLVALLVF